MKARFVYEDGTEMIFRHFNDREAVRMADGYVNEHGMIKRIMDEEKIKGFGRCDSRNDILLRNGLVGNVEKWEKGYNFSLYESEFVSGFYEPTKPYHFGTMDCLENGSILCSLDRYYGCNGAEFDVDRGIDNIIINEESAFATVFADKIDFKINVELGAKQCDEIEKSYGKINNCLVHVLIDKDRNLSVESELYMKDLTVLSMDSKETFDFFTVEQLEIIKNYTRLFFVGREAEFDLSDSIKEDLETWSFDKVYMNSELFNIKDSWIDRNGNEFTVSEITEDGETFSYARVLSNDIKKVRVYEFDDKIDRKTVIDAYDNDMADYYLDQLEMGNHLDDGPRIDTVKVLAEKLDKFASAHDSYKYRNNLNIFMGDNSVEYIYSDLTNGKLSKYMEWFENGELEETDNLVEAKALYKELKNLEESFVNVRKLGAKR